MNTIHLTGCTSTPLASYLKSLGVFRILGEQAGLFVEGFWLNSVFALTTELGKEQLEEFFCSSYRPTALVAPWNGGSGFFPGDNMSGINAIANSSEPRFKAYREVIREIRSWPEILVEPTTVEEVINPLQTRISGMSAGNQRDRLEDLINSVILAMSKVANTTDETLRLSVIENESKAKNPSKGNQADWIELKKTIKKAQTEVAKFRRTGSKEDVLNICRNRLPDEVLDWLDAAYAVTTEKPVFSPLLGTGGNEGRLDYTNNFMQRVSDLLIDKGLEERRLLLQSSLWGQPTPGLKPAKIGQFDPGKAGGFNQGMGIEHKDIPGNPWDYVFTMEGALMLAGAISRRSPVDSKAKMCAPFSVHYSSVGFGSSASSEQGRGEIWLPLWREPTTLLEIKQVYSEGRSMVGRNPARNGLEFSRAVSTLGVDRGIESFERYAFLERRGQSYVALPAGRYKVTNQPTLELLGELDYPLGKLDSFLREFETVPASLERARRQIDEAIFLCSLDAVAENFRNLVRALGRMEQLIARRDRSKKPLLDKPLIGLSPRWISLSGTEVLEVRIAAAISSIQATDKIGSLRSTIAGTAVKSPYQWSESIGAGRWEGVDFSARLANALIRRVMESEQMNEKGFPGQARIEVSPHDVMGFLYEETDDEMLEELCWGFMLIDWKLAGVTAAKQSISGFSRRSILSRTWCLLKLLHTPGLVNGKEIPLEPRIPHLLIANRCDEACNIAARRLRTSQVSPINIALEDSGSCVRLLASLMIPIHGQEQIQALVLKPAEKG